MNASRLPDEPRGLRRTGITTSPSGTASGTASRKRAFGLLVLLVVVAGCKAKPRHWAGVEEPDPPSAQRIRSLTAGADQVCALYNDGSVACWGPGAEAALGRSLPATTAVRVEGVTGARRLSVGPCNACALDAQGGVTCWGYRGWVCAIERTDLTVPVVLPHPTKVGGLPRIRTMQSSAFSDTSCGIGDDGELWCWGSECTDALKEGSPCVHATVSASFFASEGFWKSGAVSRAVEISIVDAQCAQERDGRTKCWSGGITNGHQQPFLSLEAPPEPVERMSGVFHEMCFVLRSGEVDCRSTDGIVRPKLATPARTAASRYHDGCATGRDGSLTCWRTEVLAPAAQENPQWNEATIVHEDLNAHARMVVADSSEFCMLDVDDVVTCWGDRAKVRRIAMP